MPTSGDPRWMVRFSAEGGAVVAAAAASVGVTPAGLIRVCAERHAVEVARAIRVGEIERPYRRRGPVAALAVERRVEVVPASGAERAAAFRLMTARRAR